MKIFPFRTWIASFIVAGFLAPGAALAYDPPALCAYPASPWPDFVGPIWYGPSPDARMGEGTRLMCEVADSAPEPGATETLGLDDGRAALAEARRLAAAGRHDQAVLQLRQLAAAIPALADRTALEEADARMAAGPSEAACEAYARAEESPHRAVALRARIGRVRCLLAIDDPDGPEAFEELARRYPELPQQPELELALADGVARRGDREEAGTIYRRIDLMSPGSPVARLARERLEALAAVGVEVRALTATQEVDRVERLVRSGPMGFAREELARVGEIELPAVLRQQLARSAARVARVEGRWEDASALLREARGLPELDEDERAAMDDRIEDLERAAESREVEEVRRRLRGMSRGPGYQRTGTARLFAILRLAARTEQVDIVDEVLAEIRDRDRIPPGLRFDAAILATGTGSDEHVAALFGSAVNHPTYGTAARYHHARALERLGRRDEAIAEYAQVVTLDSDTLPYYAMWSRQRLRALRPPTTTETRVPVASAACQGGPFCADPDAEAKTGERARLPLSAPAAPPPNPFADDDAGSAPDADAAEDEDLEAGLAEAPDGVLPDTTMSPEETIATLEPVRERYGEAFPWIARAQALIALGEERAAADELHETYTAWRDASGQGSLRAGLEGVLRGAAPPRHRVSTQTWRARRVLDPESRRALARASAALGDPGLAIRFARSFDITGARPFAFEELVTAAARRHGVEPELLHAVMRVESVYNPRIISYAGAIGLMQIMPRTGRLIAAEMGRDDFTVDQLLEPEVNIELAAWYLSSLIERFDGRLPLAIASYNGGPHNVRRWMRDYSPDMPVDAFLEQIPFSQTHRYVRRVLTHYEAYRRQRDLQPQALHVALPEPTTDTVAF